MAQYIAFLRAINVGGHTVKMEALRELFTGMGFAGVETFIASGNVIFESEGEPAGLEQRIETGLQAALGYEVVTFVRTPVEVAAIAQTQPFPQAEFDSGVAFNVGFLKEPLSREAQLALTALTTDIDDFRAPGREVYWLCRTKQSDSTFSNVVFEKKVKARTTFRGMNTIQRLVEKVAPSHT
jgi:uncharacterized protein (DUF1697 family)